MIAGSEAGSLWHSQELYTRAKAEKKELFIIDGATHMDLYAGARVAPVMHKLSPFKKKPRRLILHGTARLGFPPAVPLGDGGGSSCPSRGSTTEYGDPEYRHDTGWRVERCEDDHKPTFQC